MPGPVRAGRHVHHWAAHVAVPDLGRLPERRSQRRRGDDCRVRRLGPGGLTVPAAPGLFAVQHHRQLAAPRARASARAWPTRAGSAAAAPRSTATTKATGATWTRVHRGRPGRRRLCGAGGRRRGQVVRSCKTTLRRRNTFARLVLPRCANRTGRLLPQSSISSAIRLGNIAITATVVGNGSVKAAGLPFLATDSLLFPWAVFTLTKGRPYAAILRWVYRAIQVIVNVEKKFSGNTFRAACTTSHCTWSSPL